jgi:hypothetical protein
MTRATQQPWQQGPASWLTLLPSASTALLRGSLQVVDVLKCGCV